MPGFTVIEDEPAFGIETGLAVAGDFNGDDHQDVLAASGLGTGRVALYTGDGTGTVTFETELTLAELSIARVHVFDLNGDGTDDFVAMHRNRDAASVVLGGETLGTPQVLTAPNVVFERGVAMGDFDRDGFQDLAFGAQVAGADQWLVQLFLGTAAGFEVGPELAMPAISGEDLEAADFTGDGFVDLVVTTWSIQTGSFGGVIVFPSTPRTIPGTCVAY